MTEANVDAGSTVGGEEGYLRGKLKGQADFVKSFEVIQRKGIVLRFTTKVGNLIHLSKQSLSESLGCILLPVFAQTDQRTTHRPPTYFPLLCLFNVLVCPILIPAQTLDLAFHESKTII